MMSKTYRFPVFIMENQSGLFTACLLEEGHPWSVAKTRDKALYQVKEYLLWKDHEDYGLQPPAFFDPQVFDIQVVVRPEYHKEDRILPCSESIAIVLPCVHGLTDNGLFTGYLPTLNIRFYYYEKDVLKTLAVHYAQAELSGKTPLGLTRYYPPRWRAVQELVVELKGRTRRPEFKAWHEDEEIENLAIVAEPLSSRQMKGRYTRACRRDSEVADLVARISAGKNSLLLVGDAGVGKTTILGEAARRLELESRRSRRKNYCRLWLTNAHRLIAGMRFLGQWEERCQEVIRELSSINGILCVENLLDLVRSGGKGPLDSIAAFFGPYIQRGELTMIAECTQAELDASRRLLPGLAGLFQIFSVPVFSQQESVQVIREVGETLARNNNMGMEDGVADMTYRLFSRFAPYASFPGQTVSFMSRVFNEESRQGVEELTRQKTLNAFIKETGLPELFVNDDLTINRDEVLASFRRKIIAQENACTVAADLVTRFKAGMNDPCRPIGVLIFCGPTGVGKTALARRLADYFFGHGDNSRRLIRLDMSEYGSFDGGQRLVTGPDGGPSELISRIRSQPFSLVLLDEVEKAHPRAFDVLMNVFDEGRLTDPFGRVTVFCSSIIVMTSNLGSSQKGSLGFGDQSTDYDEEVKRFFRPEFFNRMDTLVTFDPLDHESVLKIAQKELSEIPDREGFRAYGLRLNWTPAVVEHIAETGFDAKYGARPLQRAIEKEVVTPMARLLAEQPETRNADLLLGMEDSGRVKVEVTSR